MSNKEKLWLDKDGTPVITTTESGDSSAKFFDWTPAVALPEDKYRGDMNILKSVIDLHTPIWVDYVEYCKSCLEFGGKYPCPTASTIQKEKERNKIWEKLR